ncbi:endonuclease [Komagataeibacter nataicola]|uniref:Phospholipase D n=2 Tax=Komagataeibacter nataicola TaxID=265960 RepID=A0A9N7H2R9_9PROT|nr:phospholipase D family protein [Komagataeibacter nataicola]AQU87153.1 endonuclease [Komagataeibacter nataicola]WNM07403.1 phospholipase D family protein [Komagataeibacter nataicola]GBR23851.1 endonuclease [Komagataeibacter nataicola NRIC 0616]
MKSIIMALLCIGLTTPVYAQSHIDVGFSPEGSATELVLNVIRSAKSQIRMMAFFFSADNVVDALIKAKKRGVDVAIVLDEEGNKGKGNQMAIARVRDAGIQVRMDDVYAVQHDKVIITDGQNVETGSFNFTKGAQRKNSENALVIWDDPTLAQAYLAHWQNRWDHAR